MRITRLQSLKDNVLAGFALVTILYLFSMRGLIAIQRHRLHDEPGPIKLLEAAVTAVYAVAIVFLIYVRKSARV